MVNAAGVRTGGEIGPRYLLPAHCTGWSAMHQIARAIGGESLLELVGLRDHFDGALHAET